MKKIIIATLVYFSLNGINGQTSREYIFSSDSVHVFSTPSSVNSYYLPYNISNIKKPMFAEPFNINVSFPNLAQNIYAAAGNYTQTVFGGDSPDEYGWGYGAVPFMINEVFSQADFPIILEADFFNRSSYGGYNESYFWIGNSNYTHFNPSNSVLPTPNVQQGVIIGGLPNRTLISFGGNYMATPVKIFDKTHSIAEYDEWNQMKTILDILDDGRLVIYNVFLNDVCVLPEPIVVAKSSDLNINSFKLAICVDDFGKEFKVTKNAFVFELPDIVVCENQLINLSNDFEAQLCINLSYNWNLPGSNLGASNIKSPSNLYYEYPGNYPATLTISNGQFVKVIPFEIHVDSGPSHTISQQLCSSDSIFFNNQWIYSPGLYHQTFSTPSGCDSIVTLDLAFSDTLKTYSQLPLCQGDSTLIAGTWFYEAGNYQVMSKSVKGCDSVSLITVEIIPKLTILDTLQLCKGDSILVNNHWYFEAQDVSFADLNSFCPTIVTSTIVVQPSYKYEDNLRICPNDSILFQKKWITESGLFSFDYQTQLGCDSVYILNATRILAPPAPRAKPICEDSLYSLEVEFDSDWTYQWSNGTETSPTFFPSGNLASLSYIHTENNCAIIYKIVLPSLPSELDVPFFADTIVYPGKTIKYVVGIDTAFWSLYWYLDQKLNCSDCFHHEIHVKANSEVSVVFNHRSGCEFYRNFNILIDASSDLFIPNVFAPESTSGNDKWRIIIPECFSVQKVLVYDRWGNLVYFAQNPQMIEWDGLYHGYGLIQGVYTYLIQFTDPALIQKIRKGDVTLLK